MESSTTTYTFSEVKNLGKAIKAEMQKVKMLKKLKRTRDQEVREVKRTIECILDNTIESMMSEDAR